MIRKRQFFGAAGVDIITTPLFVILNIIIIPIYFNFINNNEYGLWLFILEIISLGNLFNSGIHLYAIQMFSERNQLGEAYFRKSLSTLFIFQILVIFFIIILLFISYNILPFFEQIKINENYNLIFYLMILNLIITSFYSFFTYIMQAQNKLIRNNIINSIQKFLYQILPLFFLYYGMNLFAFPISYIITGLLILISIIYYFQNFLNFLNFQNFSINILKKIFIFCSSIMVGGTGYFVINFTDTVIIANFLNASAVTIYVMTMKMSLLLRFLIARFLSLSFTTFTQILSEGNFKRLQELSRKFFRFSVRGGTFFFVLIINLNQIFVINWVGYDKYGGEYLSLISALICMRESIYPVFSNIIYATKDVKYINNIQFVEAILNICLSILMVNIFGITGVALATLISFSFFSLIYSIHKSSKIIKIKMSLYFKDLVKIIILSFPSYVVIYFSTNILVYNFSWFNIINALILACITNIIFFEGIIIFKIKKIDNIKNIINFIIKHS